jgi:hypothetical protein
LKSINSMAMRIRFLDIAQIELDQAIEYYNNESPGLGDKFLTEILKVINRIGEFPEAWHRLGRRRPVLVFRAMPDK